MDLVQFLQPKRAGSTASRRVQILLSSIVAPALAHCGSTSTCSTLAKEIGIAEREEIEMRSSDCSGMYAELHSWSTGPAKPRLFR